MSGRGRYLRCSCCGGRIHVAPGQVWAQTAMPTVHLQIIECYRDGAIVEDTSRPQEGRFGFAYSLLIGGYRKVEPEAGR